MESFYVFLCLPLCPLITMRLFFLFLFFLQTETQAVVITSLTWLSDIFFPYYYFFVLSFSCAVHQRKVIYFLPLICCSAHLLVQGKSVEHSSKSCKAQQHLIRLLFFCFPQRKTICNFKMKIEFVVCVTKLTSTSGTKEQFTAAGWN